MLSFTTAAAQNQSIAPLLKQISNNYDDQLSKQKNYGSKLFDDRRATGVDSNLDYDLLQDDNFSDCNMNDSFTLDSY